MACAIWILVCAMTELRTRHIPKPDQQTNHNRADPHPVPTHPPHPHVTPTHLPGLHTMNRAANFSISRSIFCASPGSLNPWRKVLMATSNSRAAKSMLST
jgi:hypothetical protein